MLYLRQSIFGLQPFKNSSRPAMKRDVTMHWNDVWKIKVFATLIVITLRVTFAKRLHCEKWLFRVRIMIYCKFCNKDNRLSLVDVVPVSFLMTLNRYLTRNGKATLSVCLDGDYDNIRRTVNSFKMESFPFKLWANIVGKKSLLFPLEV